MRVGTLGSVRTGWCAGSVRAAVSVLLYANRGALIRASQNIVFREIQLERIHRSDVHLMSGAQCVLHFRLRISLHQQS